MNCKSIFLLVLLCACSGVAYSQSPPENCIAAPQLDVDSNRVITVDSVKELYRAVNEAEENTTIVLEPGVYLLTAPVSITTNNITIRGLETRCDQVVLTGKGMDNPDHQGVTSGIWINAANTTVANMTISEVYHHPIQINGESSAPRIYNVRMINAGQQFIKSNPMSSGLGVNDGIVEYSIMQYTDGTPKTDHDGAGLGYTQGVDVHGGVDWRISNNRFLHFHTPDNSDHLWNPAVLMWRGSAGTITENNVFINVDRAIAYGLGDSGGDHIGGVIRNNLVYMSPGLYSKSRKRGADAVIVVWDSPGAKVLHNTILTSDNTPFAVESRFNSAGVEFKNNLADAPLVNSTDRVKRQACKLTSMCKKYLSAFQQDNEQAASASWFINPSQGDLRFNTNPQSLVRSFQQHPDALLDFYGVARPATATAGAVQAERSN